MNGNRNDTINSAINSERIWTKDFIIATISGLFFSLVFYITMTTFAVYAVTTYHVNESMAGLVAGVFVIGSACGRLLSGRYVELVGRRKTVIFGAAGFFVIGLAYLIPVNIIAFLIIRFFHGAMFGIFHNALVTVVTGIIPLSRRGEGMSYFSLNFVVATAFGPFIGLFFIHRFSYQALFVACSVLALFALILILFMKIAAPVFTDEQFAAIQARHTIKDIFEKKAMPIAAIIFIMSICYTGVTAFLDSYTIELNMLSYASVFFIVYGAVIIVVRPLAGKLLDQKGDNIVMYPAIIFYALALLSVALTHNLVLLIIAAILMALGYGNILTVGQVIAANAVPHHRISTATSTYFVCNDLGMGFGPLLMGLIAAQQGFVPMYLIETGIVIVSLLLYYILHGKQYANKKEMLCHEKKQLS
ncbi:MAG: MFS transporter [Clostridiales Family XIII bacterium]|jgi:MFS family permease|nr:MFS transporter [Clostridiales Family XIII bacterium]